MIELGFINPSSEYLHDPFKGDPHTQLYMLTGLESRVKDVNPKLIDLRGIKREFAHRHIPECDVYLHSVYTLDINEQKKIVSDIREHYPKAVHIAGGPHVIEFPEDSLKTFDTIVIGEGEETIIEAVNDFRFSNLKEVYRQQKKVDINDYPFALRKYLPKSSVARKNMMTLKSQPELSELLGTTTLFSRGCPYKCAFCEMPGMKQFDKGSRYRKPESINEEIEYLKQEYGIQGINLLDEIGIPLGRNAAVAHLEAIADTGITWRGQTRVDAIDREIAKLAKSSGCIALGMGVESAAQQPLDLINKRIKVEQAKETIRTLKEEGIETRVYMILGLPGEPRDIVQRTKDFIDETEPDLVYLSMFAVRPGTEVYSNPKKFGIKQINTDWEKTMHLFGRYEEETPTLTFEYEKDAPWGRAFSNEELVSNLVEVQAMLRERGMTFA